MVSQGFDKDYWESHWQQAGTHGDGPTIAPNPYLERETGDLAPGTALDAGCGEGAEARWLAAAGWQVTAVDISPEVLARATGRAPADPATDPIRWVEADLTTWEPGRQFDLVTTHYAHPAMPQLAFYRRIADWVAPGGTLLLVGHLHVPPDQGPGGHAHDHDHGHAHQPPEEASVSLAAMTALLDPARWQVVTAEQHTRTLSDRAGAPVQLDDVVLRATRHP